MDRSHAPSESRTNTEDTMSTTLIVLAIFSAIALPAVTTATVIYVLGAAAFVTLAAVAHRFLLARERFRKHVKRVA